MKIKFVIAAVLLVASVAHADDRRFIASSVPNAGLKKPGRVVITNDSKRITAWHFFGNIREALVSLRSTRSLVTHAFGSVLYNSNASVTVPDHLSQYVKDAARTHGVDPRLVAAIARRESAWNERAVSNVGACGIMQLMPDTAKYLGVKNVFDPKENILGGTRYLRTLLDTFHGDLDLALAAYNAGPGAVEKHHGVPPYSETKAYVAAVRANYEQALATTTTPSTTPRSR